MKKQPGPVHALEDSAFGDFETMDWYWKPEETSSSMEDLEAD